MSINATRIIRKRIIFKAELVLTSAAVFSNGDSDPIIDMMILRDSCEPQKALLPGSSLAGALRSYLKDITKDDTAIDKLFGCIGDEEVGEYFGQSRLLISDAVSREPIQAELRDGVRIDHATRTAADQAKYDLEVLPAGTCFSLELEFIVLEEVPTINLLPLVVQALHGLQTGQISLGMKKNRGLGQCSVKGWDIYEIDMTKPTEIFGWLERDDKNPIPTAAQHSNLYDYFGFQPADASRYPVTLTANFTFADDAMLIRSALQTNNLEDLINNPDDQTVSKKIPDPVHLQTRVDGTLQPVIPGTSWAGVLRHRALRILNTLKVATAEQQLDELFGFVIEQQAKAQASRIMIKDSIIQHPATEPLVQNRIAIDRFTGGAFDGALFSEMPVWKTDQTCVTLEISIKPPRPKKEAQQDQQKPEDTPQPDPKPTPKFNQAEVGLLLLLLKDLWTGDLAIGGTSSIGRGRLQGLEATLTVDGAEFCFKQATDGIGSLHITGTGKRDQLQMYVEAIGASLMKSLSEIIQHFIPDQASTIQGLTFKWLLAFAIDGVIWGKFDADRLIMYEKSDLQGYNEAIQASYTPFRSETLQQMLIFGEQAQLSIWRDDDQWGSHIIRDSANIIDETQILWGTHAEAVGDWTFLTDGNQGMHHLIPLDLATCNAQKSNGVAYQIEQKPNGQRQFKAKLQFERTEADWRPAQLVLHHSIEFDEHGIATIRASRYVDLRWQTQGAEV